MRVLVTGASGFVGSALCDELTRQGHELKVLMRRNSSNTNLGSARVAPVYGDLRDAASLAEAVREAELIFHVAGVVMARNRTEFFASNAEGTRNLVWAAEKSARALQRFVYISSLAAAGPSTPERVRVEEDVVAPVSFYGESKLAGEGFLSNLPFTVIRPPAVYGPRDRGMLEFFKLINSGVHLGLSGGERRRYSFVHVQDLVRAIMAGAVAPAALGQTYFVSGDEDATWDEAMRAMAVALERRAWRIPLPLALLQGMGAVYSGVTALTGKPLPMSLDKVKELRAASWTCSNAKAKRDLGFVPEWGLARGLAQTAAWYREARWL